MNGAESRIALELPGRYKLARNERQIASELSARLPRRDRSADRAEAGGGDAAAPSSASPLASVWSHGRERRPKAHQLSPSFSSLTSYSHSPDILLIFFLLSCLALLATLIDVF